MTSCEPLVIYNTDYDIRLMAQTAALYGLKPFTAAVGVHYTMLAYAQFYGVHQAYSAEHAQG